MAIRICPIRGEQRCPHGVLCRYAINLEECHEKGLEGPQERKRVTRETQDAQQEVKGTLKRMTAKALLVTVDKEDIWFPLSQIDLPDSFREGAEITFLANEWILEQKGLI